MKGVPSQVNFRCFRTQSMRPRLLHLYSCCACKEGLSTKCTKYTKSANFFSLYFLSALSVLSGQKSSSHSWIAISHLGRKLPQIVNPHPLPNPRNFIPHLLKPLPPKKLILFLLKIFP